MRAQRSWRARRRRCRRAFTLIELVVVLAIIGVLAALVFSVISLSREGPRRVTCVSNLKQLYNAFQMYAQDWGEWPPFESWPRAICPKYAVSGVMYCPVYVAKHGKPVDTWEPHSSYNMCYAPNGFVHPDFPDQFAIPPWRELYQARGEDAPLLYCAAHATPQECQMPPVRARTYIVLRAAGNVETVKAIPYRLCERL